MATLKLVVLPAQGAIDGTHKIRIAVSHQQKTTYIVQSVVIDNLSQFKNGKIVGRPDAGILNRKLRTTLNELQDILDRINADRYTCAQLKDFLVRNHKVGSETVRDVAEAHINSKTKESTRESYARSLKYFIEANGDMPLEMLTEELIVNFERYLRINKKMNSTSCAIHLRQFKSFVMPHIKRGKIRFTEQPFAEFKMPASRKRQLDLTFDEFKLFRDAELKDKHYRVARDIFCLSYYLGGINLIDLMKINFKGATEIEYVREKSRDTKSGDEPVRLTIQPEAQEIINRWMGKDGKLDFGYNFSYDNFRKYITRVIRKLAIELGINKRVVYYSARKTIVQHGYELGISLETLEYMIGQTVKKNRPIFNYVRIMQKHADNAMRMILDELK